mgnify:CR=1 FL=1
MYHILGMIDKGYTIKQTGLKLDPISNTDYISLGKNQYQEPLFYKISSNNHIFGILIIN